MGTTQSRDSKQAPKDFDPSILFSLEYINGLFKKMGDQHVDNKFNPKLDSAYFSSLIENLISNQYTTNLNNSRSEPDKSFFLPLIHDIDFDYKQEQTFTKCFEEMQSKANTILEKEFTSKKNQYENLIKNLRSGQPKKTSTNYLEDFFLIPFEQLLPNIDQLEVPNLITCLQYLNNILEKNNWSEESYNSPIIGSIRKMVKKIYQIDKFKVHEIQTEIIKFLFNISRSQTSVNNVFLTLKVMLSLPPDFSISLDQIGLNLKLLKSTIKNTFSFPFEIHSKILSFSIGSNILVLAKEIGMIQFIEPEPITFSINLNDDSKILDTHNHIYIFSNNLGTIQCFACNQFEILSRKTLDISTYINSKHEILACGFFESKILILQRYKSKLRITAFNENLEDGTKKIAVIKLAVDKSECEGKFFYFNRDELHVINGKMIDKAYQIRLDTQKTEYLNDFICTSFIPDGSPIACFKNIVYSLSQSDGKIIFVKNFISLKNMLKPFQDTFTPVMLPIYDNSKITAGISSTINDLTLHVDYQLNKLLEGRTGGKATFFIRDENSTVDECLSFIESILGMDSLSSDIKVAILSLLIKIISINVFAYSFKFETNEKKFDIYNDNDKNYFGRIRQIIEKVIFSPESSQSPLILESVSILIALNFHYLFFPNYGELNQLVLKIFEDDSIKYHFLSNYSMLSKNNCFFYMFSPEIIKVIKECINDNTGIENMLSNSIDLINSELKFLADNKLALNEELILPYFEFLFSFMEINFNKGFSPIMQKVVFRLMVIDDFPMLSICILKNSIPIIKKLIKFFQKDSLFVSDDLKYIDESKLKENNDEEIIVFESPHNYEPNSKLSKTIKFEDASTIHLTFDIKCKTDPENSSLRIYENLNDENKLIYSLTGDNWIQEIDILAKSITIEFESKKAANDKYWGFKVTCSPKMNSGNYKFSPYLNLFYFNLFLNVLGKFTYTGLKSIPQSTKEKECKFILEGDLLEGVTKLFRQKDIQIQLQSQENKNNANKRLIRGLSNGISFDATNGTMKYPDELKKEFINDLISEKQNEKETLASSLLNFMYKAVKAPHQIKPIPSILQAEKYMIAALMKQLGFINSALSFATSIINNTNNESFVVPPNLDKTWKSIYRMRTFLYRTYQKAKKVKVSSNENESNNLKLHDDFDSFINEIIIKCKFLLFTEPILKKRNYTTEIYDSETIEKTTKELLSFITSELLMENLNRMVEKRTKRIKIRFETLSLMNELIDNVINCFYTSKISYLTPLKSSLKLIADHSDVKSVPNEMIDELNKEFFTLFNQLISLITDPKENDSSRLFYLKMLSVSIENVIPSNKLIPSYLCVMKSIQNSSIDSIESFISFSCLWRIVALWTLEYPSKEIINSLLSFTTNSSIECSQYYSILLLAALSQKEVYKQSSNIKIDDIFNCFNNASPRVVVATFIWLSSSLINSSKTEFNSVKFQDKNYSLNEFVHFILNAIGSTLCGHSCKFISEDSMHESHMIIAEEMITFLRILIRPYSKFSVAITTVFHEILSKDLNLETEDAEEIFELIAIFNVLGKEIVSFHNGGYSIMHNKEISKLAQIKSFDPISGKFKYFYMNNNTKKIKRDKKSQFEPSTRLPANPKDFVFSKKEVKLFESIQEKIISGFDNLSSVTFSIFYSSFISFLTITLQNIENAKVFVENVDLSLFLNCAKRKKDLNMLACSSLIIGINRMIIEINNISKKWPKQNPLLPLRYSLAFHADSSQRFLSLYMGKTEGNRLITSQGHPSFFVGDNPVHSTSLFYYEITIISCSSKKFFIGFTTQYSFDKEIFINCIDVDKVIPQVLQSGDVLGCEYSNGDISFYYNGVKLNYSVHCYYKDFYTPAFLSIGCKGEFEYNFGHKPFVTNIMDAMEDEILKDSIEHFDVKVPIKQTKLPSTFSFEDDEYDAFINRGNAVWEISKVYPNSAAESEENAYFQTKVNNNSVIGRYNSKQESPIMIKFLRGQPVSFTDNSTSSPEDSKSAISLSSVAKINMNRFGLVVDIRPSNNPMSQILIIESDDPMQNKKVLFQIDSSFVKPIKEKFLTIMDNANRVYLEKYSILLDEEYNSTYSLTLSSYLNNKKNTLFLSAKSLIVLSCRHLSLIFIDYFRYNNNLANFFDKYKATVNSVLSLIIQDSFKFIQKPKISIKWSQYLQSDLIFNEENYKENYLINYFCLYNNYMIVRYIRALIYSDTKVMDSVIKDLISNSINLLSTSNSQRDDIFDFVDSNCIIESSHPLNGTEIKRFMKLRESSTGFIPIIHSKTDIGDSKITIDNITFNSINELNYSIFNSRECAFKFTPVLNSTEKFGLLLCIFQINKHFPEKIMESSLGGIHNIFILLSTVFSEKQENKDTNSFPITSNFLKKEIIPKIASLMNNDNFFIDLFAFDIIKPILMFMKWNPEDITSKFEDAFKAFTSNLYTSLTKWEPLNTRSQQGILISLFTRLLIINILYDVNESKEKAENEIAYLYDTFIKTKTNDNSSIYEQISEAIAVCIALGFNSPINIRFPSFLIAEKWAENAPCRRDFYSPEGKTSILKCDLSSYRHCEVEFVNEEWLPKNCSMKIVEYSTNKKSKSIKGAEKPELFDKSFILSPGKKMKIENSFDAFLIDSTTRNLISSIESDKKLHIQITGYPNTHEAKRDMFVRNYSTFVQHVNYMSTHWIVQMDEALSRIIKSNPNIHKEFPLNTHEGIFLTEPLLSKLPSQIVICRLHLFRMLDNFMPNLIKIVDLGNTESLFGSILSSCKSAISTAFKMNVVNDLIGKNGSGSGVNIKFNRFQASLYHTKPENPAGKSLLDQFISQVPESSLPDLKRSGAPWKVDLIGEGATDAGGPGRDLFTEVCMELMDPSLGLFIVNPNKRVNNSNGNQELLIPNPTNHSGKKYFYAGVLMSLCYLCSIPEPFKFSRFVWDYLTNSTVSIEDIYDVDLQFKQLMTSIENCEKTLTDPSQFSDIFAQNFQVQNSLGEMVDLFPGGSQIPVTFNKRLEFVQRCKTFRIKEFNEQLSALKKGFNLLFPPAASAILTPWEISLLVCGDNMCPVEEMKKHCKYNSDDKHVQMLWEVLESFTPQERMLFIKFGCGRMGLPPPGMKWHSDLSISFTNTKNVPDNLKPLPTAATCNSQMTIPRYSTSEWMAKKIRAAITLGADIDQDHSAHISDLHDFT